MRKLITFIAAVTLACQPAAAQKDHRDALQARVEAAQPKDRPKLYVQLMRAQVEHIDALYTAGDDGNAQAAVKELVAIVERTVNTSIETRKNMKGSEIAIRKVVGRLNNIERSLSYDQRPPVTDAIARIEEQGTRLLNSIFEN